MVLLVAVQGAHGAPLGADTWWAAAVRSWRTPWLTVAEQRISLLGGGIVGGVLLPGALAVVVCVARSWRAAVVFLLVEVLSAVVVVTVKVAVGRPRPHLGRAADAYQSFPSGHVANATTMAVLLVILLRPRVTALVGRLGLALAVALAVAFPLLMATSRTYLNRHWLTDTIAGASLAAAIVLVCTASTARWVAAGDRDRSGDGGRSP